MAESQVNRAPAFCGQCGTQSTGAPFCSSCGARVGPAPGPQPDGALGVPIIGADQDTIPGSAFPEGPVLGAQVLQQPQAPSATQAAPVTQPAPTGSIEHSTPVTGTPAVAPAQVTPSGKDPRRPWVVAGVVAGAAILIVAIAVGTTLALSKGATTAPPSYTSQASTYLRPVVSDNAKLAYVVALIGASNNIPGVVTFVTSTQADVKAAQDGTDSLNPTGAEDALANQVKAALSSESAWLTSVAAVLGNTSSPDLSQLSALGLDAQTKFTALGQNFRVARHGTFPATDKIVAYASANNTTAQSNQENLTFSNQVLALLNQSTTAYTNVNTFYSQLQNVADGGFTDLTLPQAEQQINAIVASRTSLAAAAQALNAPTPQSQAVAADLVTAFNDSLKDDNDLATCLNEANNGTDAVIYGGCLSASSTDNTNATADKQTFLAAYNQLRASVGQPPTNVQF